MVTTPVAERPWLAVEYRGSDGSGQLATDAELAARSWATVRARLEQARNYWVVTAGPDGRPHARPYWGHWLDGAMYFQLQAATRTRRNLAANPRATVHLESGEDVVVLEGAVEELGAPSAVDPTLVARVLERMASKYGVRPTAAEVARLAVVAFRFHPETAFTWTLEGFPRSVSRWRLVG